MDHNAKYPYIHTNQAGLEIDSRPYLTKYDSASNGTHTLGQEHDKSKGGRKILGLPAGVFWAIIVSCALAIGGAVGGGVGTKLATRESCDSSR